MNDGDTNAAVSRAYYAAFYAATAALLSKGEDPKTHHGIQRRFHSLYVAGGPFNLKLAEVLSFAADARQRADYDAFTVFDERGTSDLIGDVEHFVDEVEEMLRRQ